MTAHINWHWVQNGLALPSDFNYPDYKSFADKMLKPIASKLTLNPNKSVLFSFPVDPQIVTQVKEKKISLYVYGTFKYLDVYKNYRSTTFCQLYVPENEGFTTYHEHNELL